MADDFDVEAMLEAPYRKEDENGYRDSERDRKHRDKDKERDRKKSDGKEKRRDRDRDRDKDRDSHRDRDRDRDRDRERARDRDGHRDKDKERRRSPGREKRVSQSRENRDNKSRRSRSRDRGRYDKDKRRSRSRERGGRRFKRSMSKSPLREPLNIRVPEPDLTPEERDARTVFCMQLSARIRPRDLEEFFSSVGKVNDVRIITDNKTRRSKGIAYVEFKDVDSVPLALGLGGQRLLGVPIMVQASQAEKNRQANAAAAIQKGNTGPMRLYVGSLHFNITEDMLRGIFEPFGKIAEIKLIKDQETLLSRGYGFVSFHNAEDAKKALEQLNGFELAGRPMKVGHVTERTADAQGTSILDSDEMDRAGIDLGATGRLQLMAKLAEGTGFQIPQVAANALSMAPSSQVNQTPPIATQCFMLSNMFDPATETTVNWDVEIRDDVIEECNKHGGVLHIYVDKASPQGNVYVKCPSISAAVASVNALHGRYFAGKVITAAYVPLPNYHQLFPEALRATQLLLTSTQSMNAGLGMPAAPQPMMAGVFPPM